MRNWILAALVIALADAGAPPPPGLHPRDGQQPYVPTALEWFVVKLNSAARQSATGDEAGFWFQEAPPNTVLVLVTGCRSDSRVRDLRQKAELAESLARSWASMGGFDWIKTRVEVCGRPLELLPK